MHLKLLVVLCFVGFATTYSDGSKTLLFVQSLWRHGDRSPTKTFKSDGFQEADWQFGGSGWGQLSPTGMRQHLSLGRMIRQKYVNEMQFLAPRYNSKEIYVRSTDVNRTIISAFSNLLGQYGQDDNSSIPGTDYPDIDGWPRGFVPIAIHTVEDDTDHVGNVDSACPLQDQVWELAKQTDEIQQFANNATVVQLLQNLTNYCNENVTIDNLWIVVNSLYIEQIHFNDTLRQKNPWFSEDLFALADQINDQVQLYQNGIFNSNQSVINGHDVALMLRKIRGGPILNDIVMHMNLKVMCMNQSTPNCTWINNLKHYIYSAHDTTIYAFFSALLIEEYVVKPAGYPLYSACVTTELYWDTNENAPYFKMLYHKEENAPFVAVTKGIDGCPQDSDYCKLEVIQKYADVVRPDQPSDIWCYTSLNTQSAFSNFSPLLVIFAILQFLI